MKRILHLSIGVWLFSAGCATSSINVIDKKTPTRPYSKVLVVYVEEACDFTLFDSLTYNICLKSCFLNADNFEMRSQVEDMLSNQLTTATVIVRSTDVLDVYSNSYDYFRHMIDSLHIDALLMVDFHRYTHTQHQGPSVGPNPGNGHVGYTGGVNYRTLNAGYECYLIKASSINFPIWTAEVGTKGHIGAGKSTLNMKMARTLAKSLKSAGYWMH
jgi:hypothetical protein